MSANITVSVRTAPPGRGSTPSRSSILTRSAGMYLRLPIWPAVFRHRIRQIGQLGDPGGMPAHLTELELLNVLELVDDRNQRLGDGRTREPDRQKSGGNDKNGEADQKLSDRG